MQIRIHEIEIDIDSYATLRTGIEFVSGDSNSNTIVLHLTRTGAPYDISDASRVTLTYKRADGTVLVDDVAIIDASGGELTYTMQTSQMLVEGLLTATLEIYGSEGQRLTSNRLIFLVRGQLDSGNGIISSNEYPILTSLITDLEVAIEECNTAASKASMAGYKEVWTHGTRTTTPAIGAIFQEDGTNIYQRWNGTEWVVVAYNSWR